MSGIIFDLDGTLVDSKKAIASSINFVRKELYSLSPLDEKYIFSLINSIEKNVAKELYGVEGYEKEAKLMFEEHYTKESLSKVKLFSEIKELLVELRNRNLNLFVATNAPTHSSIEILKKCKIEHYFKDIIGADRVEKAKPNPQMIKMIVSKSSEKNFWMVGDSYKDILAAQKANINPIFAAWGTNFKEFKKINKVAYAKKPKEVLNLINFTDSITMT